MGRFRRNDILKHHGPAPFWGVQCRCPTDTCFPGVAKTHLLPHTPLLSPQLFLVRPTRDAQLLSLLFDSREFSVYNVASHRHNFTFNAHQATAHGGALNYTVEDTWYPGFVLSSFFPYNYVNAYLQLRPLWRSSHARLCRLDGATQMDHQQSNLGTKQHVTLV